MKVKNAAIAICLSLAVSLSAAAIETECKDESGNPAPCQQDPGGGGGGAGGDCSSAIRGYCQNMIIYEHGGECLAEWCENEPASDWTCSTNTRPACEVEDPDTGEIVTYEINVCSMCGPAE